MMDADERRYIASSIIVEGLRPYPKGKTNPKNQREKVNFPFGLGFRLGHDDESLSAFISVHHSFNDL